MGMNTKAHTAGKGLCWAHPRGLKFALPHWVGMARVAEGLLNVCVPSLSLPETKHACLGRGTCSRESQDWFPHGQNHRQHCCQQQPLCSPRILPTLVYCSDPG